MHLLNNIAEKADSITITNKKTSKARQIEVHFLAEATVQLAKNHDVLKTYCHKFNESRTNICRNSKGPNMKV